MDRPRERMPLLAAPPALDLGPRAHCECQRPLRLEGVEARCADRPTDIRAAVDAGGRAAGAANPVREALGVAPPRKPVLR